MYNYTHMVFAQPKMFWLLLLIPLLVLWYLLVQNRRRATLQVASLSALRLTRPTWRYYIQHLPFALRMLVLTCLIAALARPQSTSTSENVYTEGIDIVLALDISTSMLAQDLKPDRIQAAKDIATQFIADRPADRIGLVVFAGESFTQCPLTNDRVTLVNLLKDVECGMIEDGTAIGNGLATAVSRLKDSKAISRIVILLTDGVNNRGEIAPITAAELAKVYGIRVYTIGVGTLGTAPYPMMTPWGVQMQQVPVEIDEAMLGQIASMTNGKYFRATSNTKLLDIYNEINQLEKAKLEVDSLMHYQEEYIPLALTALALLLVEVALRLFVLRRLP